ncbi:MAG: LLM class flavin-dependent oxidoreductase, partial [Chloroflexia bacterium]|nr:LLM class flavin-dependent oxidoreductase [Chloroflexia bacterium]
LGKLNPPPVQQPLPILIGGSGEKVTLRIVAQHAHIWHGFGNPDEAGRLSRILDDWCEKVGRNPSEIERSVTVAPENLGRLDEYMENGLSFPVVRTTGPDYDLDPLQKLIEWRDSRKG